jgi:hypothetical protein
MKKIQKFKTDLEGEVMTKDKIVVELAQMKGHLEVKDQEKQSIEHNLKEIS